MMYAILLIAILAPQSDDPLQDLEHRDPTVRALAARLAGKKQLATAVGRLVRLASDDNAEVKTASTDALVAITGRKDVTDWNKWWGDEGRASFPENTLTEIRMRKLVEEYVAAQGQEIEKRVRDARYDVRFMTAVMAVSIVLFLGVMIFFVGHVSSKVKGWRDLVSRAEVYIKQSQELTERTDKIVAELDAKKVEVMNFFTKLREENESLLDRYKDELEKDLQNTIREEVMRVRAAAEKELEQTVADLKTQLAVEARTRAAENKVR